MLPKAPEMVRVIKAVSDDGGSVIMSGRGRVHYTLGAWTHANPYMVDLGYGLTYFKTLENALECAATHRWSHANFFEALAWDVWDPGQLCMLDSYTVGDISSGIGRNSCALGREPVWPPGTGMARAVLIQKQIPIVMAYKLLWRDKSGALTSVGIGGKAMVGYLPLKAQRAPHELATRGYHLTAFSSREAAVRFRRELSMANEYKLFRVLLAYPKYGLPPRLVPHTFEYSLDVDHAEKMTDLYTDSKTTWPAGTIMGEIVVVQSQLYD